MGILVPFSRVLPYSAGTGSPVSSPVLCMVGQVWGRFRDLCCLKNKTFFQKLFAIRVRVLDKARRALLSTEKFSDLVLLLCARIAETSPSLFCSRVPEYRSILNGTEYLLLLLKFSFRFLDSSQWTSDLRGSSRIFCLRTFAALYLHYYGTV